MVTYVDHDGLLAHLAKSLGGADGAPIELDGATDTIDTAAEDNGALVFEGDVVRRSVVRRVQVVGVGGEFGSQGIDLLDPGTDVEAQSLRADLVLGAVDGVGDLSVRETEFLGLEDLLALETVERANGLHFTDAVDQVLQLVEEPLVDLGQIVHLLDRVVLVKHGLANGEPSAVGGVLEFEIEVVKLVALESDVSGVDLSNGLLERLFKSSANGHDFSDRLHGTANVALDVLELGKIPSGDFRDNVVERWFEVSSGGLGDGVGQLGQRVAETNLGGRVSQRVTGGLGGEGGRSGKTGVDFNDTVVETVGLQSVLDVALSYDSQMSDDLDGGGSEHVVLLIAESLTGGDDNGVTSVNTQRVKVLHVANSDAVVVGVTDYFVFDFLPALERLLDQNLGRQCQRSGSHVAELFLVVGETRSQTTERVGGSDNDRVSDLFGGIDSFLDGADSN